MTAETLLPAELPSFWVAKAEEIERYAPAAAAAFLQAARELQGALAVERDQALTLEQAAAESGMHRDTLRHLVSAGKIPNAGKRGAPRIRRRDLPRRAGASPGSGTYDPAADAIAIVSRHRSA